MGMSTHIQFLRSKDNPTYQKMLAVYNACKNAGIDPPEEVEEYFGWDNEEYPLEVNAEKIAKEWGDSSRTGFELKVSDIPKDVDVIRFYNSW